MGVAILLVFPLHLHAQTFGFETEEEQERARIQQQQQEQQQQAMQRPYQIPQVGLEEPVDPESYLVGPGDQFAISILSQTTLRYPVQVGPDGVLAIPAIGTVDLNNKTLTQTDSLVKSVIHSQYKNARVVVAFEGIRKISCFATGAVKSPGKYELRPVDRVYDLVQMAGGYTQRGYPFKVELIHRDGRTEHLDLMKFRYEGDLDENPKLKAGDRVVVPTADVTDQVVFVRTGFQQAGLYPLRPGQTLSEFLDNYNAYLETVEIQTATIFRRGKKEPIVVDLMHKNGEFVLQPGDEIELETVRGVIVNGFVQKPGRFPFQPNFTVSDYVALAGGVTPRGSLNKTEVIHQDGSRDRGLDVPVQRGDIIMVTESTRSILAGDISVLGIFTSVTSLVLTYIAATN